jgi:hypothetical protein
MGIINTAFLFATASAHYWPPMGSVNFSTSAAADIVIPYNCTISNLYVYVSTNGNTASGTITLYHNDSSTTLQATVTASTTGTFSDTTHSISISAGDSISFLASQATTAGTTGFFIFQITG